jgi:hypothetical protein
MKILLILCAVILSGCQQNDISQNIKDPMAEAAKTFCNQKGENLVGYEFRNYSDNYNITCGGWKK